mmetsp:Transcript_43468/g.86290  ORF Transcript_43468/g.86290 Transcript_43468/m.86290 type:complete len:102 (-) Transcript_43468:84-389(-)
MMAHIKAKTPPVKRANGLLPDPVPCTKPAFATPPMLSLEWPEWRKQAMRTTGIGVAVTREAQNIKLAFHRLMQGAKRALGSYTRMLLETCSIPTNRSVPSE